MRFQALMPDILHWFGIKKIDNMVSMSDMYAHEIRLSQYVLYTDFVLVFQEIQRHRAVRYTYLETIRHPW